ncbi:hypothetical protein KM043_002728 [Ampulex compressa]|nr:hypothetical protein KM043_002728 [Ampulex compressa]
MGGKKKNEKERRKERRAESEKEKGRGEEDEIGVRRAPIDGVRPSRGKEWQHLKRLKVSADLIGPVDLRWSSLRHHNPSTPRTSRPLRPSRATGDKEISASWH